MQFCNQIVTFTCFLSPDCRIYVLFKQKFEFCLYFRQYNVMHVYLLFNDNINISTFSTAMYPREKVHCANQAVHQLVELLLGESSIRCGVDVVNTDENVF